MNTLLAQALLQEQRYYRRTSSFPSPLSAPLLHHEIGTPLMPTDPSLDPTSSSSSPSRAMKLRPFMRPGESRQDREEGIGVAPRSAWPSEEAYQKALRAYDRAQAFLAVQGGAESENTRWHHSDPMSPYTSGTAPRGGVDPSIAAMQEREFHQGLARGAISEYKAGKIAELAEQARMTPSDARQLRKQASLLISGGQTAQTWMAVEGDGTKMETRAERLALEEAAQPEIAAFYEKMAQAASRRAGRDVSVEEIRAYVPSLSKQQLDYVTSTAPVDVALAGPGSGKSTATRAKVLHDIFIGGANPRDYLFTSKTHSANRNFMEAFNADAGTGRRDISELIPEWTRDVRERQVKTLDSVIRRQLHNDTLIQTDRSGNFSPFQLLEHVAKSANHRHLLAEEGLPDFQAGSTPLYRGTQQGQKGVYLEDIVESSEKQLRKFIEKALKQQGIEHGHYDLSEVEHYVIDSKQKQQTGGALEQRMARGRALFEQYDQGGRQLPSSQQVDPDLALYVTQQSLAARPGFTVPGETGPHYTLADEGHMVSAALRIARKVPTVRVTSPFKRLVSDEFQDADPNHVRALRELAGGSTTTTSGRPPVRMAFSGDMGQMAIQRSYPIDRQIMEAFHGIGVAQHTFTGNYRSGPYGVALSNAVNLLSVTQGRPKSPNQVSMLPLGKTDRAPKMYVGPDYENIHTQMVRKWLKYSGLSFTKIKEAMDAGTHPFAHLAGTVDAPGRNPFVFPTKNVQKAFRETLRGMATQALGKEHARTFMSKYVLPERTLPGPEHALMIQPLKINQIRGRDAENAYIDVSPAGLWDAAGHADNLRVALSRAVMQNHLFASMKVIPGTTPHDMTPSTFQGGAVAPGFDVLLQVMSELAHHQQNVSLQQMPRWMARAAVAISPLTNAHAGGEGPVQDSDLMERYANEVFALNRYYQPATGAGIHGIDAIGSEHVYSQGDEREDETAMDRMNIAPALNNLLGRKGNEVDRTQLQLVNSLMRQTLTQGPKGGALTTDLPEDPQELFDLFKSMFGRARTKDDPTQMEKIPGAGSNPYFPMYPLPRKEEFSGKTEGIGYRALEKSESDLDPIFGPEGNITGWKPAMKRYYQEYAPLALASMAHEHGYSSDPNSPGRAADGEFPSAFIPDDEQSLRAKMAGLLVDDGLHHDPFVRESMPGLMRRFIGEIYEQHGVKVGKELVPKAIKELLTGSGPFAVGLTPDFVYATAEAAEGKARGLRASMDPDYPDYLRGQAANLRKEYGKHGDIFTPLELSQEGLDRMGRIDPFHALVTRHLLQDGSLFLHKDELQRLPQEDRTFLGSLWKRGAMSYEGENHKLVMSKEQFGQLSGGESGEKKRAYQLMRSKLYPVGATNAYGETIVHPEVQKRLHTLDLLPANVMRTLSLQEGEQMGIPLHQMRNAPALARVSSYFSLMSKGMGLNETGGVFDPEVGHYSEKHGFHPLGAPMSLPQYEKRLRDRISRMQPDDLKTSWGAQTWQQYEHVRSMRQSFSSSRNQQRYAHVARVLLRATTGQDVQSANYSDRAEMDPVKTLFAPAIGHARSIEQIAAVHQAFEGAASHLQEHGGLRRSHVDTLLTALGHDPADQQFGMLRHLEQTYGFAPSDHNSNPFLPLEGLLHQAKLVGKERNSMVAQLTRTPLLPGVQYQFMGGEPEFGNLTLAQEQVAGLRSGLVGRLEHFNEKTPFGTSKYLGATFGARMFSQDESDYWNQFYDRKTKKNQYERLDMQPLFQFNTQTPEGESLRFPVRADQLRFAPPSPVASPSSLPKEGGALPPSSSPPQGGGEAVEGGSPPSFAGSLPFLLSAPQARLALPPGRGSPLGRGFTMVPPDVALPDQINLGPTIIPAGGGMPRPLLPEHAASRLWNPDDEPTEKRAAVRPPAASPPPAPPPAPTQTVKGSVLFSQRQPPPPPKPGGMRNGPVPRSFLPPRPDYAQRHSSSSSSSGGGSPPTPPPPPPPFAGGGTPPGGGNNGSSSSIPIPNLASLGALLRTSGMVDVDGVRVYPPTDEQRHILDTQQAHMLIEGGPGGGKTLTVGTKAADMVARGEIFPREIVAMSATRSGAQELTKRFGWVQSLLNQIPGIGRDNRYTMPHASTFHGLAYRTLFGKMTPTAGEEGGAEGEAQSSPLMEAMGLGHFKIEKGILSDISKENQKWMTPTELEMVKGIHSQSDFFKESVQDYLQGRKGKVAGVEADLLHKVMNGGEKGVSDVLKGIGTIKRGTVADYWGDGAGVKGALKTGEEHVKQGIVSKEALLHLYKKRQDEKGMLDFDDIVNYAGIAMQMAHTGHISPDLLPDFLSRHRLFAVDEGQDLFHNQARLLKGMMEHSRGIGGDPRLLVGFDRGQALFSGMGGIDDPIGVYSAMAGGGGGKDQLSPIQLRGNMRSDRIDVAMNNAILSMPHMKNVSGKSPLQYPFSPNRGRDPAFKLATSQRTLYRDAFQSMLKKAGVSFETMKENVARGAHPFEGIDWNDSKHVLPSEIPMITMMNDQQDAFARHAQGLLAEKLEIPHSQAHDVLKQILQRNPPTDQMSDEEVEQAKYKFWNMKVAGARSHQFLYPHMDVTRVGQWRNDKNLVSYTQGAFTGLSRVSQGGQNTILATNHPPNAWETGNEPDGATKRREDKKNRFERYNGQLVPAMFGQILGERDRQLAAFGPPPPQQAPSPSSQQPQAGAAPSPTISAGQITINTGPQPTINVSAQGPTNIGSSGVGMGGVGPVPLGPTPTGPTTAYAAAAAGGGGRGGGGGGTSPHPSQNVWDIPTQTLPTTPFMPSIAGIGTGGGGSGSGGGGEEEEEDEAGGAGKKGARGGGGSRSGGKTPVRKQTLANNDESNLGRTLARIGGEMQFVGKLFDQITTQALEQGSAYRRASLPMQGDGATGTEGFYDFKNAASGISQMSSTLPMYSKVQLAQSLRSLSAASGNQMTNLTGGTQSILQLAAVSGVDPSELIGSTTNIAGTMGMARNTSLASSFLGGSLSSLYGGNLSPENVQPTLSAIQQTLPTMQGLNLGGPPQLLPLTALLQAGLAGGMTASNMGDMAQTIGALAQVGSSPDLQQQYALSQLFGAKNLTSDVSLAEYQHTQVGERQQLSELALQQNIGNGMSLPQLQINVAQAEVSMEKANLDMSALQYSHDVASFQFQQQQQTQELGPIGADVSRNSYFNFMRNQMQAGYNPLSAETGTTFKSSPVFGLQNAEFYAGVEHQRTMLTLGRSPLLSDAAFQEQMKYLNEQEAFYHEQLKLQNEQRQFEKTWTQKLLDEQGVLLDLQKKRYALDVQMNAYQQKLLHLQEQFLPQQAASLSALITAQGQSLRGQGPVNGQMVSPDQIVSALAAMKDPAQLNAQIRGLNLAPADQGVLLKMVQGVQKYGSLTKLEASQQTSDKSIVSQYQNMVKQGAFADKTNTASIADAFLNFAGTNGTWAQFVKSFQDADNTWKQIGSEAALLNSTMKQIATTLTILGPLLTAVGLIYNLLGFLRNIPGQGGGGAFDYTNPGRYMTGAPKIPFFGAGMYPDAPQVNMKTQTVKGKTQYSLDGGKTWQNDNNFVDTARGAIGNFFTKTIPDWWSEFVPQGQQQPHGGTPLPSSKSMTPMASGFVSPQVEKSIESGIGTFFSKTLPEWWTKNVGGPFGAWLGGLPKWWSQNIAGPFNNWLAGLPKWFSQNIGTPFSTWIGGLPKWFSQNIAGPFSTWIGTLPKWWSDNIADPIMKNLITPGQVFFTKTLPDAWNTLFTKTIPNLWSTDVTVPIGTFFSKTLPDLFTKTVTDFLKGGGSGNSGSNKDQGNIFSSILGMFFGNPPKGGGGPSILGSTPTGHPGFETPRITTEFGQMSAGHGPHQGVDFAVPQGTPIKEFIGGRVIASSFQPWGGEVDVQIPGGMIERYLHLSALGVTKGQIIPRYGFLGLSGGGTPQSGLGTWSTGPHSHVQIDHGDMLAASNPWPIWAAFGATDISAFYGGGLPPGTAGGGATFGHGGAGGSSLHHLAMGGIALSHLRTSVGESGPEAIIPLSRLGAILKQVQQQQTGGSGSGGGSASSSSSSPRSVVVERLIGTLNLTVGSGGGSMSDQEKDELLSDLVDILETAAKRFVDQVHG